MLRLRLLAFACAFALVFACAFLFVLEFVCVCVVDEDTLSGGLCKGKLPIFVGLPPPWRKPSITIGVRFGFGRKIDGDSWFTGWFNHLPGPSTCPKRPPMSITFSPPLQGKPSEDHPSPAPSRWTRWSCRAAPSQPQLAERGRREQQEEERVGFSGVTLFWIGVKGKQTEIGHSGDPSF